MQPPLPKDYRRVTADEDLTQLKRCSHKFIKTYTNERYKILGSKELPTWRHGKRNVLQFDITEDDLAPLLSYSTCIGLGLGQLMTVTAHQTPVAGSRIPQVYM